MARTSSSKPYSSSLTESPEEAQFSVDALVEVRDYLLLVHNLIISQFTHPDGLSCAHHYDYCNRLGADPNTPTDEGKWYTRERICVRTMTQRRKDLKDLAKTMWTEDDMEIVRSLLNGNRRSISGRIWTLEDEDGGCCSERNRVDVERLRKSLIASG